MKIAINGFGRIGKQFFLAAMEQNVPWEIVINHTGDLDYIVYSLKHDSVYPPPKESAKHDGRYLYFGKRKIKTLSERDPEKLPWQEEKIDLVIECTGVFTDRNGASKHLMAGAKRVLISAPAKNPDCTIIVGVNDQSLKKNHFIISAGSCTTNCVAPLVKVLHDAFNIKSAFFVTTHAYTATQELVDSRVERDIRRGRAAAVNIVPATSGAAQSVIESIPTLQGKLDGYALRVPVVDGSIASVVAKVKKKTTKEAVNNAYKKYAYGKMKHMLEYSNEALVSSDIIQNPNSCIFDANFTNVLGDVISIAGWYDNEWGYSCRLVDVAKMILRR
jgi:glyceraldehyde 3-phosphate dehydrogenase